MPVPPAEAAELCVAGSVAVCLVVPVSLCLGALLIGGVMLAPVCCLLAPLVLCLPCALCCCPPSSYTDEEERVVYRSRPLFYSPYFSSPGGPAYAAARSQQWAYSTGMTVDGGEVLIVNSTVFSSARGEGEQRSTAAAQPPRRGVVLEELTDADVPPDGGKPKTA